MSSIREIALAKAVGGSGGGEISIQSLSATANGTYNPGSGKAYKPVYVEVPNSYTAGDEGKVVSGGELVSQTSRNVSANGTVDTTLIDEVVVAVPNTYSQSDEGKVVSGGELVAQGSQTVTENGAVDTTLIDNLTVNVSGGVSAVKLMDHGQVSDTSQYMAATFENAVDFSAYDCLLIYLFRESETHYGATNATGAFDIAGGLYNNTLKQTYSMEITTTQISCTSYRGSYVDIYVDVYGVNL